MNVNGIAHVVTLIVLLIGSVVMAATGDTLDLWDAFAPLETHGFVEMRSGVRTQNDPHAKDISVLESRLQLEVSTYTDWLDLKVKGDAWADGVTERGEYDTRELWMFARPSDFLDVKIGRQVLTWGTGELVFLNDLFPKDWQSFFIGRDMEYLKAPSDAVKVSVFTDWVDADLVYTPSFDADRFVTGEYVSYWDAEQQRHAGRESLVSYEQPDRWFRDDEFALRLYKNIYNYECALYGYWGFWKKPAGQSSAGVAEFPKLHVYGASLRGQLGPGIGNLECVYYRSTDDESGENERIDNSEMRYLLGYTQELARDLNAGLQYYVEQMLQYGQYRQHATGSMARDCYRHVLTLQVTQALLQQTLELSLSSYYSPSDEDAYLRPGLAYKATDTLTLQTGANIFCGHHEHTFFSQFKDNTNIYAAIRYSF